MLLTTPPEGGPPSSPAMQTLQWASCHLGILFFGSLALAALLVKPRTSEAVVPERRLEAAADPVEDGDPLFI